MSKKNHRRSPEIPQVGNALEIPNYVIPMTDLACREAVEQTEPRGEGCGEDCRPAPRGEDCRR